MSSRNWFYQTMINNAPLVAAAPGGVHPSTSLKATPQQKPYIMFRQTSDTSVMRGDDQEQCRRVGYLVFAHDAPGSYLLIDDLIVGLQALFQDIVDQDNGIIRSTWLETSDDLRDEDMGTIMKFGRVSVVYRV